jgi:membrane associated rhomboid family serine protease
MGIYDRNYYRELKGPSGGVWGLENLTPVVRYLLLANIAVFLLQIFMVREVRSSPLEMLRKQNPALDKLLTQAEDGDPEALDRLKKDYPELDKLTERNLDDLLFPSPKASIVQDWFELDTNKVVRRGQAWRLVTHAFCHDRHSIFHILFNMLCLYWFGSTLEMMYGSREFLMFYLTAAVVSALAFVGLDLYTGSSVPGIGASGAVMAVMMLYAMHFPCETICVCWFFPLEMRWVMVLFVIWDLHPVLLALSGDQFFTGIAHAAHLGGLAFGFLYARYEWRLDGLLDRFAWPRWRRINRTRLRLAPDTGPEPDTNEVDHLLRKIVENGQSSLTDEELAVLQRASERIKRTKSNG